MANRLFSPNQQYADTTGLPYAGGSLTFYASGTSTPLATYSNRALTIANTNPVVLDSAGRAGDIFLQNLAYKVVLCSDSLGLIPIWTADPVYASDFSTVASFLSGAGSPNGVVAGSQGSPTVPASVYWDTTNNILYVCTTTGTAATAVWTAVNASTAAAITPTPQGYLTLTSGVPIIPSDVTAATSVYYTPYVGNLVPIYNGSSFVPTTFIELQLTLNAAHAANNIYDCFVFNNSGVPTIVTGPSWSAGTGGNITLGTCARGTGAGGAALSRLGGIWTNAAQITGRNGATTYTINANLATYVGSIFMDATNGQVSCHRSYGQSRKWAIWNAYNRVPISLLVGDSTTSFAAATSFLPPNNSLNNSCVSFVGLPEELISARFGIQVQGQSTNGTTNPTAASGIGFNSGSIVSGFNGAAEVTNNGATLIRTTFNLVAIHDNNSYALGGNTFYQLIKASSTGFLFFGTQASCLLTVSWRG